MAYEPGQVETRIFELWEKGGYFRARPDERPREQRFCMVIPPPNVTGALHLGHALNNTLQDILVRRERMRGKNTFWLVGTDHAGIATQATVEKTIRQSEAKSRYELGATPAESRQELVRRIWEWKEKFGGRIIEQLKLMGCSCDYSRERFTLDEGCAKAVRETFFKMFRDGLIYRGKRLVNWDTQLQTAVADDEVYHEEVKGHFYHFKYPILPLGGESVGQASLPASDRVPLLSSSAAAGEPPSNYGGDESVRDEPTHVHIATTRPETMLGDTAVAVHPDPAAALDKAEQEAHAKLAECAEKEKAAIRAQLENIAERRKTLLPTLLKLRDMARAGRKVLLPLVDREIPLICDEWADPTLGSGCVKITPAHDPNDYEMGIRHGLEQVNVIDRFARMTEEAGKEFAGLDRYKARELVIEKFEALQLLEKADDYEFSISKCERCKTVIEPLISTQWFCRMDQLRDLALAKLQADGKPQFEPKVPYEKVYSDWLENLRDWTISRQLWWGHQIPAWYTKDGELVVARSIEEAREKAGTAELTRDEDVLDTWFSSALWPFSTLGWPDETPDLEKFYPTSVLITARDIIFLWVSRMMMTGLKFMGREPFADVYVTGTVLDKHGQRMSKTKGNGIDPLEVFDKFGVDATRLALASVGSTDTRWNEKQIESYRNFANKIWNAARFCLMNADGAEVVDDPFGDRASLPLHDRWIVSRLNKTAAAVNRQLATYDFHGTVQTLYHFFWDDFCDWYIESSKAGVTAEAASPERHQARARLISVLEQALRLLHPLMPYLTEELWQRLPVNRARLLHHAYAGAEPTIMLAAFPEAESALIDECAESEMQAIIDLISRVRNIRSEMNIKSGDRIQLMIAASSDLQPVFSASTDQIARLTRAKDISINGSSEMPKTSARAVLAGGAEVAIPLEGLIDFAQERARLTREKEKLQKESSKLEAQLGKADFVERAPAEKVLELRARMADIEQRTSALDQMLEALS